MIHRIARFTFISAAITTAVTSEAHGPAGAGIFAGADSAETVFSNPAGMTRLKGSQMTLNTMLAVDYSKFKVDEDVTTVDGGDPRDPQSSIIPSFYYSRQIQEDWNVGISLNVPTGFGATDGPNWAGRYYSDRSSLVYVALSPAVAYKFNDSLSVGANVRIMYADSEVHTRVNNNLVGDRFEDGRLSVEAEGIGYGAGLSMLYSFSADTRVGLIWNSQVNIDIDTEIDFRNVRLPPEVIDRLQSQTIDVADNLPMTAGLGIYHRLQNDWELTWDLVWVEFSKFGVTDISLEGGNINAPTGIYDDFFATSVGTSWPINSKMRGAVGLLWVEQPMDKDARTFAISLDEMWGIGAGITYKLDNGNDLALSVDVLDTGSSAIDTGYSPTRGRVAGDFEDHYSLLIDFTYNWR
ncbi:MAG: outer membrane protein transport protein [Halioglobus sp.]|nr:outer membrane protein transport protein [Halioglobus sp.]